MSDSLSRGMIVARWLPRLFAIAVFVLFLSLCPHPFNVATLMRYLRQTADISFAVAGTGLIYVIGDITLASGGEVYFGYALLCASAFVGPFHPIAGIALLLFFSASLGFLCAVLRNRLEIKTVYHSIALQIILYGLAGLLPMRGARPSADGLSGLINGSLGPVPSWLLIWLTVLLIAWTTLGFTTVGRRLSVSRAMERISSLRKTSDRVTGFALVAGCVLVSFSSLFLFAKMNGSPVSFSRDYTFDILAGVFIGGIGASRPSTLIPRALVGSLTIVLLNAVLLFTGLSSPMETLLKGSVILFGCYFADSARKT